MKTIYTIDVSFSNENGHGMQKILVETGKTGWFDRQASEKVIRAAMDEFFSNSCRGVITSLRVNRHEVSFVSVLP